MALVDWVAPRQRPNPINVASRSGRPPNTRPLPVLRQNLLRLVWRTFPTRLTRPRRTERLGEGRAVDVLRLSPAAPSCRILGDTEGYWQKGQRGRAARAQLWALRWRGTTRPGGGSGGAGRRLLNAARSGPPRETRWA